MCFNLQTQKVVRIAVCGRLRISSAQKSHDDEVA